MRPAAADLAPTPPEAAPLAPLLIAPSVLSADFGRLADEVRALEEAGADLVHVDVMDGRFVPNLTLGPVIVRAVREATSLPVDVHLMIVEPERYVGDFVRAGASIVSVHAEASPHLQRTLAQIRELGAKAGVVLNPHTPEDALRYVLGDVDLVLLMSVNPGFGGQAFLPAVLDKVAAVRRLLDEAGSTAMLEIDGGIDMATAPRAVAAGARVLVAGTAVFGKRQPAQAAGGAAPTRQAPTHEARVATYRAAIEALRAARAGAS